MTEHSSLKKPLLYALIVSVILGAFLGIALILRNTWGWFEVRIILTTAIVAAASLCGLACDLSKTPFGSNLLPKSGLVLTAIAAAMLLIGIWSDIDSEAYWKSVISVSIFTVATVHVCLLSIAKLIGRFQWVYFIGCQIIYGLATLLTILIVWEVNSDGMWRFVAALAIVVAAITLVIPILHRIGKMEGKRDDLLMPVDERNVASIDKEIARLRDRQRRLVYLVGAVFVVVLGLASRRYAAQLPVFISEYAGDTLWALFVFLGISVVAPGAGVSVRAAIALAFAFAIEISQFYHAPWIDALRRTTLGGLVLGFGFLWTDLICYATGVSIGVVVDSLVVCKARARSGRGNTETA